MPFMNLSLKLHIVTSTLLCSLEADHSVQPTWTIRHHTSNHHVLNSVVSVLPDHHLLLASGTRSMGLLTTPPKSWALGCLALSQVPWALRSCFSPSSQL